MPRMAKQEEIYLMLGTNVGNRLANLQIARALIEKRVGAIGAASQIYETQPWGVEDQPLFLNQALRISTEAGPQVLLKQLQEIETDMGLQKKRKWGERLIDLDILFYGQEIIAEQNLMIPHPLITERRFVLVPLAEIAPDFIHPVLQLRIRDLLDNCPDSLAVQILEPDAV